jgi:energy-coupling factor transporter transmembrane protein EcfT
MRDLALVGESALLVRPVRRHPERHLVLALAGILAAVATTSVTALVGIGLIPASQLRTAAALGRFGRRSLALAFVGVPAVLFRVVCTKGTPWLALGALSFTQEGLHAGTTMALRMAVAALVAFWLGETLGPLELDAAFTRLGVPAALVDLARDTRRFARQLGSTLTHAWGAAALRAGLSSPKAVRRTVGLLGGVLVTRALDRAERVATARAVRGHGGLLS